MWSVLRKYRQWVLLPLILLGVQWSVSYWHHHEETSTNEIHVTSSNEECFLCDWMLLAETHQAEAPLVCSIIGLWLFVSIVSTPVNKYYHSTEAFAFFFGRAPPVLIR